MKVRQKRLNQKGVAAIEFAVVLPMLVLLGVGIAEFGIMVYNKHILANASREGARAGIIQRTDSVGNPIYTEDGIKNLITDIVLEYCGYNEDTNKCERLMTFGSDNLPTVEVEGANGNFQADLSVKITYQHAFLVPSLFGLGTQKPISALTVMKMERILGG